MPFFTTTSTQPAQGENAPRLPPRAGGLRHYFAYGSNLHVAQMAQRCPESVFLGKATLPGYRWQINQRGVANVTESPDHCVEGLVFLVTSKDEKALDRSEGVSKSLYLKQSLPIVFERHERYCNFRSARLARRLAQPLLAPEDPSSSPSSQPKPNRGPDKTEMVEALVYVSDKFKTDGHIRDEYIHRMDKAAFDAIALGVSRPFVDHFIRPHIVMPAPPHHDHDPMQLDDNSRPGAPPQAQVQVQTKIQTPAADPPPMVLDLAQLRSNNRKLQVASGFRLPADMIDAIAEAGSGSRPSSSTPHPSHARTYVVLVREEPSPPPPAAPPPTAGPGSGISSSSRTGPGSGSVLFYPKTTTWDLELANELAAETVCHFWVKAFDAKADLEGMMTKQETISGGGGGSLSWRLEERSCLHIRAVLPGGQGTVMVWVEGVVFAARG